jgi:hypothetical protein
MTIDIAEQVRWESLRLSKLAVKDLLRSRGDRLSDYRRCDLERFAKAFLADHRSELIGQALGDLLRSQLRQAYQKVELAERSANCGPAELSAIRNPAFQKEPAECE